VLPAGVWQQMFLTGQQLLHLTSLDISRVEHVPPGEYAAAPEGSLIVGCCPGLEDLNMKGLLDTAEQLPLLQGLSGLTKLALVADEPSAADGLCQLTGLKDLFVSDCIMTQGLVMQLTQLKQLTRLQYLSDTSDGRGFRELTSAVSHLCWLVVLELPQPGMLLCVTGSTECTMCLHLPVAECYHFTAMMQG
jgi:hypothetical protein